MVVVPGRENVFCVVEGDKLVTVDVDIVFPVMHGEHGEDGTLQGLMEIVNIPIAGTDALSL